MGRQEIVKLGNWIERRIAAAEGKDVDVSKLIAVVYLNFGFGAKIVLRVLDRMAELGQIHFVDGQKIVRVGPGGKA